MPGICSRLNLPTPEEARSLRPLKQKHEQPSQLDVKTAKAKDDKAAEKKWRAAVWNRDKGKSRFSGKKVKATMALDPMRGERHHIVGKADRRVRWDPRNALLLELEIHQKVERNEIKIVGTKFFKVDAVEYIDARAKVKFTDAAGNLLRIG